MAITLIAIRVILAACGCTTRVEDHEDAGWSWSKTATISQCATCAAEMIVARAATDIARLAEQARRQEAGRQVGLAPWEAALLGEAG
jgi:hypothetical protein